MLYIYIAIKGYTAYYKIKRKSRKNLKKDTKKKLKKRTKKKTLRKRKTRKHRGGEFNRKKAFRRKYHTNVLNVKPIYGVTGHPPQKELIYASLDLREPIYKNVPGTQRLREESPYATVVGTTTQGRFKK